MTGSNSGQTKSEFLFAARTIKPSQSLPRAGFHAARALMSLPSAASAMLALPGSWTTPAQAPSNLPFTMKLPSTALCLLPYLYSTVRNPEARVQDRLGSSPHLEAQRAGRVLLGRWGETFRALLRPSGGFRADRRRLSGRQAAPRASQQRCPSAEISKFLSSHKTRKHYTTALSSSHWRIPSLKVSPQRKKTSKKCARSSCAVMKPSFSAVIYPEGGQSAPIT